MPMKSITFDKILYVKRIRGGTVPEATEFGFVSDGVSYEGIVVPGKQKIETGLSVTALLRKDGDWHSLVGWVNNKSGDLAVDDIALPAILGIPLTLACIFWARVAFIAAPIDSMQVDFYTNSALSLMMAVGAALSFWKCLTVLSITRQLKQVAI